jgi:hypothetical protein
MARPKGKLTSNYHYILKYLDMNMINPTWKEYYCCTYNDMQNKLKDYHNVVYSRDTLQNIALNRFQKRNLYPNVKVEKLVIATIKTT